MELWQKTGTEIASMVRNGEVSAAEQRAGEEFAPCHTLANLIQRAIELLGRRYRVLR